jgi:hypothetical protein
MYLTDEQHPKSMSKFESTPTQRPPTGNMDVLPGEVIIVANCHYILDFAVLDLYTEHKRCPFIDSYLKQCCGAATRCGSGYDDSGPPEIEFTLKRFLKNVSF